MTAQLVAPQDRLITLPDGLPQYTLGWGVAAWAARYLRHANGMRAGKPWQFQPEQLRFLLWFYAHDEHGRRVFDRAERRLAKGSGKSPVGATLAISELLAPVRFSHFDPDVPGGVVGKPVSMPLVQIAAVSQDQTENTMRHIRSMVSKYNAPRLHADYELDVGKTQIFTPPSGKLEAITSSAATAEGAEVSFVLGDELEHWTKSNGGVELHNTIVDNLAKTGSPFLGTLNAWKPGEQSVGEQVYEDWLAQEMGRAKSKIKILYDARLAPPDTNLADEQSLREALEFVYADSPWVQIDSIMSRIWRPSANPDDSMRKYLNRPVASSDAWVEPQMWAMMSRPDIRVGEGEEIALFFDGSLSNDNTALVGCRLSDGHIFTIGVWEPVADHDDEAPRIDVEAVDAAVRYAHDAYCVRAFFADVREWESYTKVIWPELFKDTIKLWAQPTGRNAEMIAWDMRSQTHDFAFTKATELTEREIEQAGFTHDGHPMLTQHVHNARRHEGRYGITVRKESRSSARKIDACVCMIGARMVRRLLMSEGYSSAEKERTNKAFFI